MSQPVKLKDDLVLEARQIAKASNRSIAGQIEHWALLGRAIDAVLRGSEALTLKQKDATRELSTAISEVDTDTGRARVERLLKRRPYPHFEPSSNRGFVIKTDEDGVRTEGRFVNKQFVPKNSK